MKKFISVFLSLLLMFSLTVQAYAAGTDLNEEYLLLDEANECLDQVKYPPGYDNIICSYVYRTESGITTGGLFYTGGSPDVRPAEAAARAGRANVDVYVTGPYEQRSYYDTEIGAVVTERVFFTDDDTEHSSSDSDKSNATPDVRSGDAEWFIEKREHACFLVNTKTGYYAEGFFECDEEDITVWNAEGDSGHSASGVKIIKDGVSIR